MRVSPSLLDSQITADNIVHILGVKHEGNFVKALTGRVVDNAVFAHIAEKRNLLSDVQRNFFVAAGNDDVRVDSNRHQLLYRMLGRLGLVFVRATDIRHEADMNEKAVASANLNCQLADCLKEGLAFNVTDSSAHFHKAHISPAHLGIFHDKIFNLVGNMGDNLHGLPQILALPLLVQHIPVNTAAGQI